MIHLILNNYIFEFKACDTYTVSEYIYNKSGACTKIALLQLWSQCQRYARIWKEFDCLIAYVTKGSYIEYL